MNQPVDNRKENQFKDAMLNSAESRCMDIIAAAHRESARQLAEARTSCARADHDAIAAKYTLSAEQEISASLQSARKDLLALRENLVAELFSGVEKRLAAFAESPAYEEWFTAKLKARGKSFEAAESAVTVTLRPQDEKLKKLVKKVLPKAETQTSDAIRLGGFAIGDGKRLFDDSFDAALADERKSFSQTSGLVL